MDEGLQSCLKRTAVTQLFSDWIRLAQRLSRTPNGSVHWTHRSARRVQWRITQGQGAFAGNKLVAASFLPPCPWASIRGSRSNAGLS